MGLNFLEIDKIKLGKIIKQHRKMQNLTQSELAEFVNLNEKQISRIEAGLNYPAFNTFISLVEILKIDINDFLNNEISPLTKNQEELISIIKNANEFELKTYLDILKPLKKNLKQIKKRP